MKLISKLVMLELIGAKFGGIYSSEAGNVTEDGELICVTVEPFEIVTVSELNASPEFSVSMFE